MIFELIRVVIYLLNWMPYYIILGIAYYSYRFLKNSYVSDVMCELYNYIFVDTTKKLKNIDKSSKYFYENSEELSAKPKPVQRCEHLESCHESRRRNDRKKVETQNFSDVDDDLRMKYKRILQQNNKLKEIGKRVVEASITDNSRPEKKKFCCCESREHKARSSSRHRHSSSTRNHNYIDLDIKT